MIAANITWRDDDVSQSTVVDVLTAVDDLFQKYRVPHTIAIIASGLDSRPELIELIRARGMVAQLHCWEHDDLSVDRWALLELERARDMVAQFFPAPTILYPPWNRTSPALEEEAARLGMVVSWKKVSLSQFIRFNGEIGEDVVNFHHWHVPDAMLLERALSIFTGTAIEC